MTQILDPLLTLLLNYGYPVVALCVISGYAGIPIPSDAILMAAGSLTVDGSLNIFILVPIVIITALVGDLAGYIIGNKFGNLALSKIENKLGISQNEQPRGRDHGVSQPVAKNGVVLNANIVTLRPSHQSIKYDNKLKSVSIFLDRWGIWCIFLTRWLLTPLAVPVNLAAGLSNYSLRKFLLIAIVGESLWGGVYIYLGYLFGANWQLLADYLGDAPLLLVLIVIGFSSLMIALRIWKKGKLFW